MADRPNTTVEEARLRIEEMKKNRDQSRSLVPADKPVVKDIRPVNGKPIKKKLRQEIKEAIFAKKIEKGGIPKYVLLKIIIPAGKRLLYEICNQSLKMTFGIEMPKSSTPNTHVANASTYRDRNFANGNGEAGYPQGRKSVSEYDWDRALAEDVYTQCMDVLDRYPTLGLDNVYSIMNMPEMIKTTDKYWGWTRTTGQNIELVCVDETNDIWRVVFPRMIRI